MTDYLKRVSDYRDPSIASAFASVFDELSFWSSRFGHLLFKHIEFRGSLQILDLGFGTGFPLFELAHTFGPSCHVTGLDPWKEAVTRARLKQKVYELPNVTIMEGDGAKQPFDDETFDLIVSNLGVNNFAEPARSMAECFRVARPRARLVLTTNVQGHYREFYALYGEVLKEMRLEQHMEALNAQEAHRGTKENVCALLEGAGFKVSKVIEDKFEMRFLDGSAMLRHSLVRFGFLDGWRSVVNKEDEEEVFSLLERHLNEAASAQGELRMTVPMLYVEGEKPK
ncbi:MAG: methyltransferase domain-containing protein [Pyrinomonadaceae bacterium]|nr:methyltransferase domain-containing protein [Pyrinomonadaceae bacterium]